MTINEEWYVTVRRVQQLCKAGTGEISVCRGSKISAGTEWHFPE